jgi:NAD(P)-dependent dehydrogenase (short-subunit alcohol dehydrogenase family)
MKLAGKRALVTGASRGIGRAIAAAYAREGADLIVTARSASELIPVREEIVAHGRHCVAIEADLAVAGEVDHLWSEVERAGCKVDILVNNAGMGSGAAPKPVVEFDDEFWSRTLHLNLTVPYQLCKKALPAMVASRYGRVIAIASINALRGGVFDAAYTASKSGLVGLMRTVAREHVRDGVTSNAICPGTCATRTSDARLGYEAARTGRSIEDVCRHIGPMGRRLEPAEIAPIAVYLASAEAAMTTGQTFVIDGGQLNA